MLLLTLLLGFVFAGTTHSSAEWQRLWNAPELWLGLGFFPAPLPKSQTHYETCFSEPGLTFRLAAQNSDLAFVKAYRDGVLELQLSSGGAAYCRPLRPGVYPDLVFYKDFQEAKSRYLNREVYNRYDRGWVKQSDGSLRLLPIERYTLFRILDVQFHGPSQDVTLIAELQSADRKSVFYPFSVTGTGRTTPVATLDQHILYAEDMNRFALGPEDWKAMRRLEVREGFSKELVELVKGPPLRVLTRDNQTILIYERQARLWHHVFIDNRLLWVREHSEDEL